MKKILSITLILNNKKKKGVTLIELVTVLAVIAILAAALVPKVSGYINEARKISVLNEAKSIITAYEAINFKYSLSEKSTVSDILNKSQDLLTTDSIKKIPTDFTISQCRQLMDAEKYNFSIENGYATIPVMISDK